jgi:methyl-accepting chemotaxis protein
VHRAADHVTGSAAQRRVETIARHLQAYESEFDKVVALKRQLIELEIGQLDPLGAAGVEGFETLIGAATAASDQERLHSAYQALQQFMTAQVEVNKFLGRNDMAREKDTESMLGDLVASLARDGSGQGDYAKTAQQLQSDIAAFRDAFHAVAVLDTEVAQRVSQTMMQVAEQLQSEVGEFTSAEAALQDTSLQDSLAVMASGDRLLLALAVCGAIVSVFMAWWIGRTISAPIVKLCRSMADLAAGNKDVAIAGLGRKDEIGEMAKAVEVFKSGLIEADRLREQGERQKAEAEKQRKAAMLQFANVFEAGIKSVAQTVSAQAAEMQGAAGSLTGTAQKATDRATAVAAAVEQASVNVQVVASSTEELSSSVHEIARQMAQSSKIARQAVQRAERTNTIVEGMTKTAQGIGDVVRLIQTIANQTNLLALNATIEAARAGDAGKGFAVVASEVKSLASQTAKATSEIRSQIDDIQAVTGQAAEAIREISSTIGEMNEIAIATASAVEEQGAATQEIANSVRQAAEGTNEIARNIEGVSLAANDSGAAATQLLGSAGALARQADSLQHDVDAFLVKVRSA